MTDTDETFGDDDPEDGYDEDDPVETRLGVVMAAYASIGRERRARGVDRDRVRARIANLTHLFTGIETELRRFAEYRLEPLLANADDVDEDDHG